MDLGKRHSLFWGILRGTIPSLGAQWIPAAFGTGLCFSRDSPAPGWQLWFLKSSSKIITLPHELAESPLILPWSQQGLSCLQRDAWILLPYKVLSSSHQGLRHLGKGAVLPSQWQWDLDRCMSGHCMLWEGPTWIPLHPKREVPLSHVRNASTISYIDILAWGRAGEGDFIWYWTGWIFVSMLRL